MNKNVWLLLVIPLVFIGGLIAGTMLFSEGQPDDAGEAIAAEPLYWVAPMDPGFRSDRPGKSPMGMDLVPVYAAEPGSGSVKPGEVRISSAVENNLGVKTGCRWIQSRRDFIYNHLEVTPPYI